MDFWEERHGEQRSVYFPDPDGVVLEITWPPSKAYDIEHAGALSGGAPLGQKARQPA